ncbi:MAG: hypothetical protein L3J82_04315 [Planctomycetes bacterium]|nr:hypothetical protein [Planctomycetota bacterium]
MLFLILVAFALCGPVFADSKGEVKPFNETIAEPAPAVDRKAIETEIRAELEKEYRAELEKRHEFESKRHEDSLANLWLSNAVIWAVFLIFIALQTLSAKKRAAELARLKAMKED